ncbi:hypothetical protein [Streptomyces indicus]|uniref:Uncharacterized protein n=1 Tax=Streptomyces indicus TaxID=417292 RepID=A0A1G9JNP1_9ACTN|nr:hypothetical protein [Streptomyces indicus]SDL38754.1 hypothetical protein SAMN05421806_1337 [Streptomyces indicus]
MAHGYLTASGVPVRLTQDRVTALATELKKPDSTAASVANVLRTWHI